jgi:hypothetical protein
VSVAARAGADRTPTVRDLPSDEIQRIAYRGPGAIAIDGAEPWSVDRLVSTDGGRWSRPGQPTIYLAADPGVALAEFGRHMPTNGDGAVGSLWMLRVALDEVAELRDTPNGVVLDQDRCRGLADDLRREGVPALMVPSVAFLDNRQRFNVVIFAEALGGGVAEVIRAPRLLTAFGPRDCAAAGHAGG